MADSKCMHRLTKGSPKDVLSTVKSRTAALYQEYSVNFSIGVDNSRHVPRAVPSPCPVGVARNRACSVTSYRTVAGTSLA